MSRALRIDLVFPRFKLLSGAERLILELAAALVRLGHRPRIVCHRFDDSCNALLVEGVTLVESGAPLDPFRNRYLNAGFDYLRVLGLREHLDPQADARVLYGPALWLVWYLRRVRRESVPLVYHCFEPPRVLYQDREAVLSRAGWARIPLRFVLWAYRGIDRRLVHHAGAITASGPFAAKRVARVYGADARPITHGIGRQPLDAARAAASTPRHDLITVNYLHPRKRVDLVIRAVAVLKERGTAARLEVVGAGPERNQLQRLVADLELEQEVRFAGFVAEDELPSHYCSARCYVHAARDESFGLSVIEAAYCGLPIVAVAEGGVVDNVEDGDSGILVQASAEGLAGGIARVLVDPDQRRRMGDRSRALVDGRYHWEQGARDLLSAIAAAL